MESVLKNQTARSLPRFFIASSGISFVLLAAEKVLRWIHESELKTVTLPDMYQRGPVRSAGMAKKTVETLKAHNHLLEPHLAAGEKKPAVICQSGKKSREWWEVHPESNSSFLAD